MRTRHPHVAWRLRALYAMNPIEDGQGIYGVLMEAGAHMQAQMSPDYKHAIDAMFARQLSIQDVECLEKALSRVLKSALTDSAGKP